jgi:hypothetical protein
VGKVNVRDGERSIIVDSLRVIDMEKAAGAENLVLLRIPPEADKKKLARLKEALKTHTGPTPVTIQVPEDGGYRSMRLKKGIALNEDIREIIEPFEIT